MQIDSFDVIPSWRYHQKNYHCIVFSVVLLNGISFYVIWVLVLCSTFFFSILLFSFNSSQSRFSPFRRGYSCGSSCVGIRVEMSWVLFPFLVLEKKKSFARPAIWLFNGLIRLFPFSRYGLFGGYWLRSSLMIDFSKWLGVISSYISKIGFIFSLKCLRYLL